MTDLFIESSYKFLKYLRVVKNSSEHTIRNYSIDLNNFKDFWEDYILNLEKKDKATKISFYKEYTPLKENSSLTLSSINRNFLRKYLFYMNKSSIQKRTLVRRLSLLRSFFKYLIMQGILLNNPMDNIDTPKLDKPLPLSISYEEVQRLFSQPDLTSYLGFRDRCIMELFYSSGLRVSELIDLDRCDFDKANLLLRIKGKGKKERIVPITKNAKQWIENYLSHPERKLDTNDHLAQVDRKSIFLNKLGTRLSPRSVDRKFDKYLKTSGLAGKITPHTIRHTIATHWLENGMNLKTIQMLLGHSSPVTTTIYAQVSSKLQKEVYDKTHPRA